MNPHNIFPVLLRCWLWMQFNKQWWSVFKNEEQSEKEKWKKYWKILYIKKLNDVRLVYNHGMKELRSQIKGALDIENIDASDLKRVCVVMEGIKERNKVFAEWAKEKGIGVEVFERMGVFEMEGLRDIQSKEQMMKRMAESEVEMDSLGGNGGNDSVEYMDRVWKVIEDERAQFHEQ